MCTLIWDGKDKCKVRDKEENLFQVDMRKKNYSCKRWDLTETPCSHACEVILSINDQLERYVGYCFTKTTYMKTYSNFISPMKVSNDRHVSVTAS